MNTEPPKKGEIWTHSKTGIPYFVRDTVKAKINGEWIEDGVIIYASGIGDRYARPLDDFLEHFRNSAVFDARLMEKKQWHKR